MFGAGAWSSSHQWSAAVQTLFAFDHTEHHMRAFKQLKCGRSDCLAAAILIGMGQCTITHTCFKCDSVCWMVLLRSSLALVKCDIFPSTLFIFFASTSISLVNYESNDRSYCFDCNRLPQTSNSLVIFPFLPFLVTPSIELVEFWNFQYLTEQKIDRNFWKKKKKNATRDENAIRYSHLTNSIMLVCRMAPCSDILRQFQSSHSLSRELISTLSSIAMFGSFHGNWLPSLGGFGRSQIFKHTNTDIAQIWYPCVADTYLALR